MNLEYQKILDSWPLFSSVLSVPETEEELDRLIKFSEYLVKQIEGNSRHPLNGLLELVSALIETYKERNKIADFTSSKFYHSSSIEEMALVQGVKPVDNFDDILGDFWPENDSIKEFVESLKQWRKEDLLLENK